MTDIPETILVPESIYTGIVAGLIRLESSDQSMSGNDTELSRSTLEWVERYMGYE